jgi:Leucine-rich repeat (LRR) protein
VKCTRLALSLALTTRAFSVNLLHRDLGWNKFASTVPSAISKLILLKSLGLKSNKLTGSIPPEISEITALTVLQAHNNELTGDIPAAIGAMTGLVLL